MTSAMWLCDNEPSTVIFYANELEIHVLTAFFITYFHNKYGKKGALSIEPKIRRADALIFREIFAQIALNCINQVST